jgi:hypothetical protein
MLDMAISVRRLAELTRNEKILKSKIIKIVIIEDKIESERKTENVWNIVGNVIHGAKIETEKRLGIMKYHMGIIGLYEAVQEKEETDALITIKSDKFPEKSFNLTELCTKINEILDEINDFMGDNGLYFGSIYE